MCHHLQTINALKVITVPLIACSSLGFILIHVHMLCVLNNDQILI